MLKIKWSFGQNVHVVLCVYMRERERKKEREIEGESITKSK